MQQSYPTRRGFMAAMAAAGAMHGSAKPGPKLAIFSKHLQWTSDWAEMAAVARECGYSGIDLTVRKGGHVAPERVGEDLPRAAEAIRNAGLELTMITAGIVDASSPHAEEMLRTASELGVRHYRWGGFKYDDSKPIAEQLTALKPRVKELADLNRRYNMTAMYHTHSGMEVGAPIWDLWIVLRDFDPKYVAINYDIGHATIEGGLGGWIRSEQLSAPYMRGVALKDFFWKRNGRGEWNVEWCAAGEGMVNFRRFFTMLKQQRFDGPVQVHYEYAGLGGAEHGNPKITISRSEVMAKIKRDAEFFKTHMQEAGLG